MFIQLPARARLRSAATPAARPGITANAVYEAATMVGVSSRLEAVAKSASIITQNRLGVLHCRDMFRTD